MLNTDLHKPYAKSKAQKKMTKKEFVTNLRGVFNDIDTCRDYIDSVYDSIEEKPILISNFPLEDKNIGFEDGPVHIKKQRDFLAQRGTGAKNLQCWVKSAKPAQELLRTVAARHDNFVVFFGQDDDEIFLKELFSTNWHHMHSAINSSIDNAHLDVGGLNCCIDVLEYSLCTASYLGMTMERSAFSKLLGRVNRFNDFTVQKSGVRNGKSLEDILQVRDLTQKLHTSLSTDDAKVELMKRVARRIRNGNILLNDPNRSFVKEGDLVKHHQLGRSSTYRFFLFSDVLVYAHKSAQGDYKVHEEVSLKFLREAYTLDILVLTTLCTATSSFDENRERKGKFLPYPSSLQIFSCGCIKGD